MYRYHNAIQTGTKALYTNYLHGKKMNSFSLAKSRGSFFSGESRSDYVLVFFFGINNVTNFHYGQRARFVFL